jgi:hypothetical protein
MHVINVYEWTRASGRATRNIATIIWLCAHTTNAFEYY